jgi:transposase
MPCVLGHALSMKAIQGGNATNDTIDAHKIAVLLRGGMLPPAYVYPSAMRATRELLRRRMPRRRKRAERLTPSQHTTRQDHLPEIGQKIAYTAHRAGVAARVADPAGHKSLEVDLALIGHDATRLRDLAWSVLTTATAHHTHTRHWLRTGPGIGEILSLVLCDDVHDIHRFPRVQDLVSDGRMGTCAKASAGKHYGTGGRQIGHADLRWAFSAAAVRCWCDHPAGQQDRTRVENTHGQGKALPILAHHWARAVSCR